jgi:hypothetical protein
MTIIDKQLLISTSHSDSNWCTPCREKPDQHTTRFPRSVPVWSKIIRISRCPHIAIFHTVVNRFEQIHCPREEGLLTQFTARRLTDPRVHTQLLSDNSQWSSGENQAFVDIWLLGLPGPYHRHAIGTFNTYSRGQPIGLQPTLAGATILEVPVCYIPLPDHPNQLSPLFT